MIDDLDDLDEFDERMDELLFDASKLPYGPTRLALVEQAVKYADSHSQINSAYEARLELIETAMFSGAEDKAIVAFAWCQSQVDKNPERFDQTRLLWSQKWIVNELPGFPQYSRQQIMAMLEDLETRYHRAGAGKRSVYKLQCLVNQDFFEPEVVRKNLPLWQDSPRDELSDCEACDIDTQLDAHTFLGEYEEAIACGKEILRRRMRCSTVPQRTYASLLLPLFQTGRLAEAMQYHKKGYPMISSNSDFLYSTSQHLYFLVLTDNTAKAVKLFEKHVGWTCNAPSQIMRMYFLSAAWRLFQTLEQREAETIKLRLPTTFSSHQENGRYRIADLRKEIEDLVMDLARRFDHRNGNSGCTSWIQAQLQIAISPFPLPETKKRPRISGAKEDA